MNTIIEAKVNHIAQKIKEADYIEEVSEETFNYLEGAIHENNEDFNIIDYSKDSKFKGIFVAKIEGNEFFCLSENNFINSTNKNKFINFLNSDDFKPYSLGFYRVDLHDIILIFKIYKHQSTILLIGHAVKNDIFSQVDIVTSRASIEFENMKETLKLYRASL